MSLLRLGKFDEKMRKRPIKRGDAALCQHVNSALEPKLQFPV